MTAHNANNDFILLKIVVYDREAVPDIPLQMLLRGANAVGYTSCEFQIYLILFYKYRCAYAIILTY